MVSANYQIESIKYRYQTIGTTTANTLNAKYKLWVSRYEYWTLDMNSQYRCNKYLIHTSITS